MTGDELWSQLLRTYSGRADLNLDCTGKGSGIVPLSSNSDAAAVNNGRDVCLVVRDSGLYLEFHMENERVTRIRVVRI